MLVAVIILAGTVLGDEVFLLGVCGKQSCIKSIPLRRPFGSVTR